MEKITEQDIQDLQKAYNNIVRKLNRNQKIIVSFRTAVPPHLIEPDNYMYYAKNVSTIISDFDIKAPNY